MLVGGVGGGAHTAARFAAGGDMRPAGSVGDLESFLSLRGVVGVFFAGAVGHFALDFLFLSFACWVRVGWN